MRGDVCPAERSGGVRSVPLGEAVVRLPCRKRSEVGAGRGCIAGAEKSERVFPPVIPVADAECIAEEWRPDAASDAESGDCRAAEDSPETGSREEVGMLFGMVAVCLAARFRRTKRFPFVARQCGRTCCRGGIERSDVTYILSI